MENEIENKWLVVEFTSFGEVLSRGELFLLDRLVQPLQEEEQRPLKTRNRSAQNVRSQLPKTVSLFENKGKLQPGNGEETLAKTILRRFSGFLFLLSSSLF